MPGSRKGPAPIPLRSEDASAYPTLDQAVARDEAERIAKLFKALADPTRVQLLGLLRARPGGECGYDLTGPLGISQPSVSYHVRILHEAGLVTRERRGSWVIYRICEERLADIRSAVGPAAGSSAPADPSP
jgi:ArsR family transcriptional regulator